MTEQPPSDRRKLTHASTGHQQVDEAVARLGQLDGLDLVEHGQVYEKIHAALHGVLKGAEQPDPAPRPAH